MSITKDSESAASRKHEIRKQCVFITCLPAPQTYCEKAQQRNKQTFSQRSINAKTLVSLMGRPKLHLEQHCLLCYVYPTNSDMMAPLFNSYDKKP